MTGLLVSAGIVLVVAVVALVRSARSARRPGELTLSQRRRLAAYLDDQRRAHLRVLKGGRR